MASTPEIGAHLDAFLAIHAARGLAGVLRATAESARLLAHLIRRGGLAGAHHLTVGPAHDGVAQKALDVIADDMFVSGLKGAGVRAVVSEERDEPLALDADGAFLVAIDPLDGSSNIEANTSIGDAFLGPRRSGREKSRPRLSCSRASVSAQPASCSTGRTPTSSSRPAQEFTWRLSTRTPTRFE